MRMDIEKITPQMIDAAIHWQMKTPQTTAARVHLLDVGSKSAEFTDYLCVATSQLFKGADPMGVIATSLAIGIEIGMALEQMQQRADA